MSALVLVLCLGVLLRLVPCFGFPTQLNRSSPSSWFDLLTRMYTLVRPFPRGLSYLSIPEIGLAVTRSLSFEWRLSELLVGKVRSGTHDALDTAPLFI